MNPHDEPPPERETLESLRDDLQDVRYMLKEALAANTRLRKIASHVPAMVYIKAKEDAGYGVEVKAI